MQDTISYWGRCTAGCYDARGMKTEALQRFRQYLAENPEGQYADNAKERIEKLSE